jgi:hypothetical protein
MKTAFLIVLSVAFLCLAVADVDARPCQKNGQAKWALHYAGPNNPLLNTCAYTVTDCLPAAGQVVVNAPPGPGRFDVYVLALDTDGIAGTRYGICCDPDFQFFFYGWTHCSHLELPSGVWPGCGEGNAQVWYTEQPAGHVTVGILDVYVYAGLARLMTCNDPRVGFAEWCDGSLEPDCCRRDWNVHDELPGFGYVGFGLPGYNPCDTIAVEETTWGSVKSMYR